MVNRGNDKSSGMGFEKESVQSLWREAMVMRDLARDGVTESHERRAEAEAARKAAEQDALKATEKFCRDLRTEAEADLERASSILADAEQLKKEVEADLEERASTAQTDFQARQDEVEAEFTLAVTTGEEADEYARSRRKEADAIVSDSLASAEQTSQEARDHADSLIAAARVDAEEIREEMRRQAAGEIRSLVADVESAQSAILEELETQRILTEAARIKATSPEAAAKAAKVVLSDLPIVPEGASLVVPELILMQTDEPKKAKAPKKARKTSRKRSTAKARKKAA